MRSVNEYLSGVDHLPEPLKDFHDQKAFFKSLHHWIGEDVQTRLGEFVDLHTRGLVEGEKKAVRDATLITWVDGHCYVVDLFLRYMAAHGWTLQRCRADVEFSDLEQTHKERRERETEALRSYMASRRTTEATGARGR